MFFGCCKINLFYRHVVLWTNISAPTIATKKWSRKSRDRKNKENYDKKINFRYKKVSKFQFALKNRVYCCFREGFKKKNIGKFQ